MRFNFCFPAALRIKLSPLAAAVCHRDIIYCVAPSRKSTKPKVSANSEQRPAASSKPTVTITIIIAVIRVALRHKLHRYEHSHRRRLQRQDQTFPTKLIRLDVASLSDANDDDDVHEERQEQATTSSIGLTHQSDTAAM